MVDWVFMIGKAYKAFDDTIMYGVNKGVKAYNWTFGGTKAELANRMVTPRVAVSSAGIIGVILQLEP